MAFQMGGLNGHGGVCVCGLKRKEMYDRVDFTYGLAMACMQCVCLLAGNVTAEQAGLDPVHGDQNTVAGC